MLQHPWLEKYSQACNLHAFSQAELRFFVQLHCLNGFQPVSWHQEYFPMSHCTLSFHKSHQTSNPCWDILLQYLLKALFHHFQLFADILHVVLKYLPWHHHHGKLLSVLQGWPHCLPCLFQLLEQLLDKAFERMRIMHPDLQLLHLQELRLQDDEYMLLLLQAGVLQALQ